MFSLLRSLFTRPEPKQRIRVQPKANATCWDAAEPVAKARGEKKDLPPIEYVSPIQTRELQQAPEWQPIETAPKGKELILYHPPVHRERPPYDVVLQKTIRVGFVGNWPNRPPTHWAPLPAHPASPGEAAQTTQGETDGMQTPPAPLGWLYDWTHSSALGKPDEHFTSFTEDEAYARSGVGHNNVRPVYGSPNGANPPTQGEAQ